MRLYFLLLLTLVFLPACSTLANLVGSDEPEQKIEGERISVLELQKDLEPESTALNAQGFIAPQAWQNEFWPQAGGYPNHAMQHLALSGETLEQAWSVRIGRGATDTLPLTAQPIVIDGKIFTLDTKSNLAAFSVSEGKKLWEIDAKNPEEDETVITGGIAYSKGMLYVTAGYDELLAISPQNGDIAWRVPLPAPSRAAPSISGGRIFVTTLDNRLLALNTKDGSTLWEFAGVSESAGLVGAASPAAGRDIVVPAFSSGEIFALYVENGVPAWSEDLSAFRAAGGLSALSDIRGLPVLDKGLVIAVSFGGRLTAIDERTGTRVWTRDIGSDQTPWVAGNHVFVISTENELVALGRDDGSIRWVTPLPRFENPENKKGSIFWTGPVLAGGRLIVVGTNERIVHLSPETGDILGETKTGRSVTVPPLVAGGMLYLLADDGTLMAWR